MSLNESSTVPRFNKDKHVKYWKRCLKTFLPSQYTSNDSNRMYLAYFIVSALELLDITDSSMNQDERKGYIDWIYHCQHPQGGFRMWPGTDFGERSTPENAKWDPAHVPATYFALTSLVCLKDDLQRVRHAGTLSWLRTMQRKDGSFGETMVDGRIEGGRDPRFGYCAAAVRSILRPLCSARELKDLEDIDVQSLARCVLEGQSYDGGIADAAFHEPQAGYTFCALGTLDMLGQLGAESSSTLDRQAVTKWLADRQTDFVDPDVDTAHWFSSTNGQHPLIVSDDPGGAVDRSQDRDALSPILTAVEVRAAGMNGRPNKVADTCYAWWVEASLHMLGLHHLYHKAGVRSYLLQLTQHPYMGGFTKVLGEQYADVYHSFMGLAALSLASTDEQRQADGLKAWDATMCISMDVRERLKSKLRNTG